MGPSKSYSWLGEGTAMMMMMRVLATTTPSRQDHRSNDITTRQVGWPGEILSECRYALVECFHTNGQALLAREMTVHIWQRSVLQDSLICDYNAMVMKGALRIIVSRDAHLLRTSRNAIRVTLASIDSGFLYRSR